jgi:hypothetical protein
MNRISAAHDPSAIVHRVVRHPKLVYHSKTWTAGGTLIRIHNHLREQVRQQVEHRHAQPSAALLDSQSVLGATRLARDRMQPDVHQPRHVQDDQVRHQLTERAALVANAETAPALQPDSRDHPRTVRPFAERRSPALKDVASARFRL